MIIYSLGVIAFVWLSKGPLAELNLRPIAMMLPIIPMMIIFPAMIRFLNHPEVKDKS